MKISRILPIGLSVLSLCWMPLTEAKDRFPGKGSEDKWIEAGHYHKKGLFELRRGEIDRACELLEKAVKTYRWDAHFEYGLACALEERGQQASAEKHFRAACKLDPHSYQLWRELGRNLYEQKKYKAAQIAFDNAIQCDHSADQQGEIAACILNVSKKLRTEAF